ncbi:MAG: hypothetical protein Q8K85_22265 [Hyphomicrobium sp.]|nr:hypothetical protein [Hyphomicrobium sp.]
MGKNASQLIDYHAARAIEQLDKANQTAVETVRHSHLELSRLHLYQASWLRAATTERAVAERHD